MTKRRDVLKTISQAAKTAEVDFTFVREGAKHTVYNLDGIMIAIPRHNEIISHTTQDIYKECAVKLGKDWWK